MTDAALHDPIDPVPASRSAAPTWFDADGGRLLGQTCDACRSVFFPPTLDFCGNPSCEGETFTVQPMSSCGTVWSWTTNHYKPPAPYVSEEPFAPYTVLAVELATEGMVVLGQLSPESDPVEVGDTVEIRTETLLEDENGTQLVWRWMRTVNQEDAR
ncbi:Zn-ribbon domain-containing OB-fold protein [Pseudonocardia xishanensis]|uniref:Zinc ribbon domain-containing protein n=1 Tax=Pseudonocardia xishanensis TaxID=630995 RepID=A0ABP8RQF7_9PSEU